MPLWLRGLAEGVCLQHLPCPAPAPTFPGSLRAGLLPPELPLELPLQLPQHPSSGLRAHSPQHGPSEQLLVKVISGCSHILQRIPESQCKEPVRHRVLASSIGRDHDRHPIPAPAPAPARAGSTNIHTGWPLGQELPTGPLPHSEGLIVSTGKSCLVLSPTRPPVTSFRLGPSLHRIESRTESSAALASRPL